MKKVKKKKKIKSSEESSSVVKFYKVNTDSVKKEKDESSGKKNKWVKIKQGKSYFGIIPPVSKEMNGRPFIMRNEHGNVGPKGNTRRMLCCRADLRNTSVDDCPECKLADKNWELYKKYKKEKDEDKTEKYKKIASSHTVRRNPLLQIIDVSGAYDDKGNIVDEIPKCFGDNLNDEDGMAHKECRKCTFIDSCRQGVQLWGVQQGAWDKILDKIGNKKVDITNPDALVPIRVKRKGSGFQGKNKTTYEWGWGKRLKLPSHVVNFIIKNAADLSKMNKIPTKEEMLKVMYPDEKGGESEKPEKSSGKKSGKLGKVKPKTSKKQIDDMRSRLKKISDKKRKGE